MGSVKQSYSRSRSGIHDPRFGRRPRRQFIPTRHGVVWRYIGTLYWRPSRFVISQWSFCRTTTSCGASLYGRAGKTARASGGSIRAAAGVGVCASRRLETHSGRGGQGKILRAGRIWQDRRPSAVGVVFADRELWKLALSVSYSLPKEFEGRLRNNELQRQGN